MKQLCLIRHAKSSWNDPALDDKNRPLDQRGEIDASSMGTFLLDKGIKPDLIISSPAIRALSTAQLIAEKMAFDSDKITVKEEIYDAGVETLLSTIQNLPQKYNIIILVGHNPGLTWLANYLAEDHLINLPTCGAYCVSFDTDNWTDITTVEGKTLFVDSPKQHGE